MACDHYVLNKEIEKKRKYNISHHITCKDKFCVMKPCFQLYTCMCVCLRLHVKHEFLTVWITVNKKCESHCLERQA